MPARDNVIDLTEALRPQSRSDWRLQGLWSGKAPRPRPSAGEGKPTTKGIVGQIG